MVGRSQSVDLALFWRLFTKLVGALLKERAHAEISIVIRDGSVQIVRVNRTFQPSNLPDV